MRKPAFNKMLLGYTSGKVKETRRVDPSVSIVIAMVSIHARGCYS